jgi:flagellar hook-associated protein 2
VSTFAVDGLASGLDTTTIINQLMAVERRPQDQLRSRLGTQQSTIAAYQALSTRVKSIETTVDAVTAAAAWSARTASVSGTAATATATTGAPTGDLDVQVTSVATRWSLTTDAAHGLDDVVFSVAEPPLTVRKADGTSVALYPPTGSMRDVMTTINEASGLGIRAVAVKVGTDQYRLQIIADDAGTAAAPQGIDNLGAPATVVEAGDAAYTINGIPATSTSNTVTDAVSGVTLTLLAPGSATVTVRDDAAGLADKIQAMVSAVNNTLEEVASQTVRDSSATTRGPLASDSAVRQLSGSLLQAVSDAVGSASAATVGLQTTRDGRLTFDRAAFLSRYAEDPDAVRAIVAPESGTGVAQRLSAVVDRAVEPTTGFIPSAIQGRESTRTDLQGQIDNWDTRLAQRRQILERQFGQLEVALSRLQSQQSWLTSQLNQLDANRG